MDIYPLNNPVLLNVFMKIISDSSGQDIAYSTISELDKYMNDQLIDYKIGNPYNLWAQHYREFPTLSILARHFLLLQSHPCKQLFSAAGDLAI